MWHGRLPLDCSSMPQRRKTLGSDGLRTVANGKHRRAPRRAREILMGYNGSDDGVRGAIAAYDAETGKEVWRFWTVHGDPAKGFETKELEMASKTWIGENSWKIGGGDVWHAITMTMPRDW